MLPTRTTEPRWHNAPNAFLEVLAALFRFGVPACTYEVPVVCIPNGRTITATTRLAMSAGAPEAAAGPLTAQMCPHGDLAQDLGFRHVWRCMGRLWPVHSTRLHVVGYGT